MRKNTRYKQMEFYMTCSLLAAIILFIFYLIAAGTGVIWLKILTAIIAIIISLLCLAFLFLSKELLRPRSIWMSTCALAILLCIGFSLALKFPSPAPPRYEGNLEAVVTTEAT